VNRADLHRLVDELPESTQETAFRILRCLRDEAEGELAAALTDAPEDPLLRALAAAPIDDEPETPEEAAAVQEAREELARGEFVTLEDLKRELLAGE